LDTGNYVCKAENPYGSDQTVSDMVIIPSPNIDERSYRRPNYVDDINKLQKPLKSHPDSAEPMGVSEFGKPPKFIIPLPHECKLDEGDALHVTAKVEGYPLPKVYCD
jgi:hypothetical protein